MLEIPAQAPLGNDQGKPWDYVVNKLNTIEKRFASILDGDGVRVLVEGLHADDLVVVEKLSDIHPGDKVKPERTKDPTPAANK